MDWHSILIALLILFALLQLADAWTTDRGLARGLREINPAMAWLIARYGRRPALAVAKLVMIAIALGATAAGWMPWPVLAAIDAVYAGVVVNNALRLRR
ncbi:MAG: DUF5658 family protein [Dechloromonas sp.]|nr:DUF5658 family protein [Dechloromonas sp.]